MELRKFFVIILIVPTSFCYIEPIRIIGCASRSESNRIKLFFSCSSSSRIPRSSGHQTPKCRHIDNSTVAAVSIENCETTHSITKLFEWFTNLNTLVFRQSRLILRKEDFVKAKNLTTFISKQCHEIELPANVFVDAPNLNVISLRGRIRSIDPLAFGESENLEYLSIGDHSLTSLPNNLLHGLTNLKLIAFFNTNFERINVIEYPSEIKELAMWQNKITNVTKRSMTNMKNLLFLTLSDNKIECIEPFAFSELNKLIELKMASNRIQNLTREMFDGLHSLEFVTFEKNEIEFIGPNTFSRMENLKKLQLSSNQLTILDPDTFSGLRNLKILDLSRNPLKEIHPKLFIDLYNLKTLDLSYGQLEVADFNKFAYLFSLEYLDLSHNNISSLVKFKIDENSMVFAGVDHLQWMDSIKNGFTRVDLQYKRLASIERSHEIQMKFQESKPKVLGLEHGLSANFLEYFQNLRGLDLSDNRIENVEKL